MMYGREVTLPLDIAITDLTLARNNPAAQEELARWRQALILARENALVAQKRQAHYANAHRSERKYNVGDQVMLSTSGLQFEGQSVRTRKLTELYIGPFRIKKVINDNAYELDLPPKYRIHRVINISKLKPYHSGVDQFPHRPTNSSRPPPDSVDDDGTPVFEVESILDHRYRGRSSSRRVEYLIRWKGYPDSEATWEPIENLGGAYQSLTEYNEKHKIELGTITELSVANTSQWIQPPAFLWQRRGA
jgi:hypothetical protein